MEFLSQSKLLSNLSIFGLGTLFDILTTEFEGELEQGKE